MELHVGEMVEVAVVPLLHYWITFRVIPPLVNELEWSSTRLGHPARLADFWADDWKLVRKAIAYWYFDQRAKGLGRLVGVFQKYGWAIYFTGLLIFTAGKIWTRGIWVGSEANRFEINAIGDWGQAMMAIPFVGSASLLGWVQGLVAWLKTI